MTKNKYGFQMFSGLLVFSKNRDNSIKKNQVWQINYKILTHFMNFFRLVPPEFIRLFKRIHLQYICLYRLILPQTTE